MLSGLPDLFVPFLHVERSASLTAQEKLNFLTEKIDTDELIRDKPEFIRDGRYPDSQDPGGLQKKKVVRRSNNQSVATEIHFRSWTKRAIYFYQINGHDVFQGFQRGFIQRKSTREGFSAVMALPGSSGFRVSFEYNGEEWRKDGCTRGSVSGLLDEYFDILTDRQKRQLLCHL